MYFKDSFGVIWARPAECVWEAPKFYNVRRPLAQLPNYRGDEKLRHLFCDILNIEDTDFADYVQQASKEKRWYTNLDTMSAIYHHIQLSASDEDDWEYVW